MTARLSLLATTAVFSLLSGHALAQGTPAPAAASTLEEVVITAQHRSENVQKAAIAIDVVGGDEMARAGLTTATQLSGKVPALQISQGASGNQSLYIRGVGTLTANAYTDPGVALNVDGIYIGRPSSMRNIFYDLQRVEVLKGPQGTLYGRNATGGAINIIPNTPRLGEYSGNLGLSVGDYDDVQLNGAVNLPLGAKTAARLAFTANNRDGYLSDGTNDAETYALRGQLLFEPSDTLSMRVSADYAHEGGNGGGAALLGYLNPFTLQPTVNPQSRAIGSADPRTSQIFQGQYVFLSGRFGAALPYAAYADDTFWGVKGQLDWSTELGALTVLAAHRKSDLDSISYGTGGANYTRQKDQQTSLEARFAGPDEGMFRWLVGAYYYDEEISSDYQFNHQALSAIQIFTTGTTSTAGFGRLTIAPTDTLRLVGGVRVTHDEKPFNGVSNIFLDICTAPGAIPRCPAAPFMPFARTADEQIASLNMIQVGPGVYIAPRPGAQGTIFSRVIIPINETTEITKTTWRAGVEYDVGANSLLYATYETGYHAGGFAFAQIAPRFNEETLGAFTIGSKNRFFDGRLQLNVEAFHWKYDDQQITHYATDTSGALVFITENAGSSTNKGVEVSITARPAVHTTVNFDLQYLDAKYDDFVYTAPTTNGPAVSGCPIRQVTTALASIDCSGRRALRSPEWTLNAGIEQVFPLGAYEITAAVDTRYQSKSVIGFEMLPGVSEQKAYTMTNLWLGFGPASKKWSVGAYVNNIEDERIVGQSNYMSSYNIFVGSPSPPRTYGARLQYSW